MFNLLENFIVSQYGDRKYEEIISASDTGSLDPFEIVSPGSYPDEVFESIVATAAEKINKGIPEMLRDMGRISLPKLAERYPSFFMPYKHPRDFLKTTSVIHNIEVKKLYQGAEVPNFFIEDQGKDGLTLSYKSKRHLCYLVEGLVRGLGDFYNIAVSINQTECTHDGSKVCKFSVDFYDNKKVPRE